MSVDQIPDTFDDPELEQAFRQLEAESHTLDPAQVMAGGRRRRFRRRTLATGAAALATAAVSALALVAATLIEPGEPPAAQQSVAQAAPKPLPTIPAGKWVTLSRSGWLKVTSSEWALSDRPVDIKQTDPRFSPKNLFDKTTARDGWEGPFTSSKGANGNTIAFIRGDVQRVVVSAAGDNGTFQYEAQVYRLAALPGWVLAHAEYSAPSPVRPNRAIENMVIKLDAYGADGRRILRCGYNPRPTNKADASTALPVCDKG